SDGKAQEVVRVSAGGSTVVGPTPVAAALSPDAKTLYIANAGENAVAVVDISRIGHAHVRGFIPTDRYPTLIGVRPDGKLILGTAKGRYGPNGGAAFSSDSSHIRKSETGAPWIYVGDQLAGRLAVLPPPDDAALVGLTQQVRDNIPVGEENSL